MAIKIQVRGPDGQDVIETSYEGCVLETRERNFHDDSDFYAIVWDEEKGGLREVEYATTRGWTYNNSATVDAAPEVLAKAGEWAVKAAFDRLREMSAAAALKPSVGKTVKVVRGRKVPIGTVGEVFWSGKVAPFSRSRWAKPSVRIGLKLADGTKVFTAASNAETVDPENWIESDVEIMEKAERHSESPANLWLGLAYWGSDMAVM